MNLLFRHGNVFGLLIILGTLIVVGGCGQVNVATNAPDSLYGVWQATVDDEIIHLLFLADGEYRIASAAELLYDDPLFFGPYQYDEGRLTITNAVPDQPDCQDRGQYVVVEYDDSVDPMMKLAHSTGKCNQRDVLLTHAAWTMAAVEG